MLYGCIQPITTVEMEVTMKKNFILLGIVLLVLLSCTAKLDETPFVFIETGHQEANQMDLYTYTGEFNIEKLKEICLVKKNMLSSGTFYYLVVFDSKETAVFPKTPYTAEYGMEEEAMIHIKAIYAFNRKNGFSELSTYEKNMWESKANNKTLK
jgi:hypothetical protein